MKLGKMAVAGLALTVFRAITGMVTCGGVFSWVYKLEPVHVWRPMTGGPSMKFFLGSLLLNMIFAGIFVLMQKGIPGSTRIAKGFVFGIGVWAVGMLPGMLATYEFMTVATTVVIYWTILGLVLTPVDGMIVAAICGDKQP